MAITLSCHILLLSWIYVTSNGLADIFTLSQKILKRAFDDAARERFKSAMQLATQSQDPTHQSGKWIVMAGASRYVNFSEIAQFLNQTTGHGRHSLKLRGQNACHQR